MSTGDPVIVVTDTSVLVNFLCIDRMDFIAHHSHHFVITDHVADEITEHYPEQRSRLNGALAARTIEQRSVTGEFALELFRELSETNRLGAGECAAIAYAITSGCALAIDDRAAANQARRLKQDLVIFGTQDIMVSLIRDGQIEISEADRIKDEWASHHRFRLEFVSFADVL